MPDHYKSPPKKKKRRGSVNPLGKPRGDVYRDTRRPDSPKKGAKGQADVPTSKQKQAAASIAAIGGGAAGKTLMSATRSAMQIRAAKKANLSYADRIAAKVPKKNRDLVKKRAQEIERKVDASRAIDAKKHGPQDLSGLLSALKDPTSEAYKTFNKLSGFKGKATPNPKSPWAK